MFEKPGSAWSSDIAHVQGIADGCRHLPDWETIDCCPGIFTLRIVSGVVDWARQLLQWHLRLVSADLFSSEHISMLLRFGFTRFRPLFLTCLH